jgi:hypothetical protein
MYLDFRGVYRKTSLGSEGASRNVFISKFDMDIIVALLDWYVAD